jgi:two-component system NtrC family sensor kinase
VNAPPTPPRRGLQRRVVAAILAIGVASVVLGLSAVFFLGRSALEETIGTTYQELAEITARNLDDAVADHVREARTITLTANVLRVVGESNLTYQGSTAQEIARQLATIESRWAHDEGVDAYLHALLTNEATDFLRTVDQTGDRQSVHLQILVTDAHGAAVAATRKPRHYDYSGDDWWQTVMRTGQPFIGDIVASDEEGAAYAFPIAYPIRRGGQVIGVLYMVHDAPAFFRLVTSMRVGRTDHTMLVSSDGVIIFCPVLPVKSHHLSERLQSMVLRDRGGWVASVEDVHYPGRISINGFAPVAGTFDTDRTNYGGKRWYIVTSQDPKEAFGPVYMLLKWVALTGLLGALVISVVGYVAARRIVRPLHALREGVERIAAGNLDHTIEVTSGDEIEALGTAFNQMTEKLRASYSGLEAKIAERTRELETKNRELFALYAIVSTLNRLGHTDEGFRDVLSKVMVTLHTDAVALTVLGERGPVASHAAPRGALEGPDATHALGQLETLVRRDRQPLYVDDLRTDTRFNLLERELGYLGLAAYPIVVRETIRGVLYLLDRDPRVFTATERALIESIAGQLAMSLENLRLSREER